ncbi:prepilin peptidase [Pseudomonas synxantha]|uniref:prepilin peptidase n=1 Tax=Pseudomonas TaxID=286 RepID=UPI00099C83CC|nr:prepilin peptidase [Pseudomonas synxantha]MCK3840660.1 prepilin peptidase [Pseudomonas sp. NCIMB 10586]MCK3843248.1 prepilin peptidase [Pseudomonas sp. W15Feb34]MCK3861206.1 prepilin peptidase [Pseudomonas sp. B329]OPB10769.1 prepilin peptidase [Pseudomonas synxantha]VCU66451.1 peptidase A24 [Pseudomonas synxantha]
MIQNVVILLWLGLCALQDMRERQIANTLTLGVGLLALIYLLWTGSTWLGAPRSDGGLALVLALALTLPGYALGRFGAGDVKLLAALGLASNTEYLLGSLIGAGIAMVAWALMHQGLSSSQVEGEAQVSTKQPFAPFVLTGYVGCWLWIH